MLTFWSLLRRNLRYYYRTHLAVVAGVAVAVGVLTGALLVGDSVRGSLRELFLNRLGKTDHAVVASGFFREDLAEEMLPGAAPLVVFEGMVANERTGLRRAGVQVYGVDGRFWKFHGAAEPEMSSRSALLTESLEAELQVVAGDGLLLRVERPSEVSRGSSPRDQGGRREDDPSQREGRACRHRAPGVLDLSEAGERCRDLRPARADTERPRADSPRQRRPRPGLVERRGRRGAS